MCNGGILEYGISHGGGSWMCVMMLLWFPHISFAVLHAIQRTAPTCTLCAACILHISISPVVSHRHRVQRYPFEREPRRASSNFRLCKNVKLR